MAWPQVGRDVGRMWRGSKVFFRYLLAKEDCEVGLGLLSAASNLAKPGPLNQYVVRIANSGRNPADVVLTIEITAADIPSPHSGPYTWFTKQLTVQPRTSSDIVVLFDWINQVKFQIDGVLVPPDDFRREAMVTPRLYSISALLREVQGTWIDRLNVYQELTE
jgi:hypothetical protein